MKIILIVLGTIFMAIGIVGIILPLLPTTPFLLLAAACYGRSSERFYNWLLGNRLFGKYIKNYMEQKGIPLKTKMLALVVLWASIICSIVFFVQILWVQIVLVVIAAGVTVHLVRIKTL
ncbi:MAG: YbaN family protein [Chloroflexi bacterium]|jgi:uncharacterized protein|nr:YbaN family protein [Chloroflexota bacterium]MBT7080201.1 YbaN family protein [Chloroflexota bacterium]MBT7290147.1 YbaN family protein [Chloroflexota bacterium]